MKKLSLLFTMLALLFVGGAQARTEKTSFDWSQASKEWNADNLTVDADNKTITFNSTDAGNAAVSWYGGTATDISGYDRLVLELEEASDGDVEVVVSNGGFWGKYSSSSLSKGSTELSINLNDLKITGTPGENDTWKTGDAIDLTQVNMIYLRTAWTTSQTIKVKDFYLAKDYTDYDQVLSKEIYTNPSSFDWSQANKEWNADNLTVDADNKTITFNSTDAGNAAVSWYGGTATDISGYDRLVLELEEASDGDVEVVVSNGGFWGKYSSSSLSKGSTELSINLSDLKITATPGENDTWKTGDAIDLTQVNMIYLRTGWTTSQTIKVKDFYLAKAGTEEYLVRENTTAGKYGTICLPFAASKPDNATVYSVVGYDDSNVYLKEAESLQAGKAYVFQSTDANDITFTKNSTGNNLTAPATATSGLIGTFTASTPVPKDSYILSGGKWLKVTADGNNTVNTYHAYLTLGDDLKVTESQAKAFGAKAMRINGGQTTAIDSVNAAATVDAPAYNLAGQRVSNGYKGVVVKNGKKYIVK